MVLQIPLFLLLLPLVAITPCDCKILGAFVLPHGGIALNPSHFESPSKWAKQWAWQIHRAAVEIGRHIRSLNPDLILLSTPHGVADMKQFQFYLNARGNGSAQTDNCNCPPCCYDIDVKFDSELALDLIRNLSAQGANVSGSSFFGPPGSFEPSTLRWGEVVPLVFVKEFGHSKLLILSHPSKRYDQSKTMIPELLTLGGHLYEELESLSRSVVVIISADLAHTHDPSGPYGFSPAAEPFDRACGNWASSLHPYYLLDQAAGYVDDAKSCGYTGLVMLHGLLAKAKLTSWTPTLHANFHPSYYGMMVASFSRSQGSNCINCTPKDPRMRPP